MFKDTSYMADFMFVGEYVQNCALLILWVKGEITLVNFADWEDCKLCIHVDWPNKDRNIDHKPDYNQYLYNIELCLHLSLQVNTTYSLLLQIS